MKTISCSTNDLRSFHMLAASYLSVTHYRQSLLTQTNPDEGVKKTMFGKGING